MSFPAALPGRCGSRRDDCLRSGRAVVNLLRLGIARVRYDQGAFENPSPWPGAGRFTTRLHYCHRQQARSTSSSTTSNRSPARPHLADTKPHGRTTWSTSTGSRVPVAAGAAARGSYTGLPLTVTGKTIRKSRRARPARPDGEVVHRRRTDTQSGIASHRVRSPQRFGREGCRIDACSSRNGPGFDGNRSPWSNLAAYRRAPGLIRYEGPKGGPMRRCSVTGR